MTVEEARAADVPVQSLDEVRQSRLESMSEVRGALSPTEAVWSRWKNWLDDDKLWPEYTVFCHGDFHPGHLLIDETERLTGVIDWTEAKISDPATDLDILYGCFGRSTLETFLEYFEEAGGRR